MSTKRIILEHFAAYPRLTIQDIFKFLYQSSFGCEHMISSLDGATNYLKTEREGIKTTIPPTVEALDGEYSRVSLGYLDSGLSINTFAKLFYLSAKKENDAQKSLENKLEETEKLVKYGLLPFSYDEFSSLKEEWKENNYPSLHHSDSFKKEYNPAYRVISNKFIPFLPLLCKIDTELSKGNVIVSIEGGSASGKTTLSDLLYQIYGCNVFHTDDFFLQPHQRTDIRLKEIGGNLDRERFMCEIITPLCENKTIVYRKFDCSTKELQPETKVSPSPLTIIEGAYSMHPYFKEYYNISVFLNVNSDLQIERIKKRNSPPLQKRFFEEWIPMENNYFNHFSIKDKCDFVIDIDS